MGDQRRDLVHPGVYQHANYFSSDTYLVRSAVNRSLVTLVMTAAPVLAQEDYNWEINDRLSITAGEESRDTEGPGASLNLELDPRWSVGLGGHYETKRFSTSMDSTTADSYGEQSSLPLMFRLDYELSDDSSISAGIGAEFGGSMQLKDSDGRAIGGTEFDTDPKFEINFSTRF